MKIALTVLAGERADGLDEFLRFHRLAGADVVIVGGSSELVSAALAPHEHDGYVRRAESARTHTDLARLAVDELGADWLVPTAFDELWWPRGESLKDVLAVIPPRYGVVQGLVRTFVGTSEPAGPADGPSLESRNVRTSLLGPDGSGGASLGELLRPVYRAGPNLTLDADDWTLGGRRVPLRAWYPLEVFRYPPAPAVDRTRIDAGLADGSLVVDTRLRDALADSTTSFRVPSIVDDSSFAVECAAVGEVDLVRLDRQIRDLELRIAALEAEFWPSVRRTLNRLARRKA